MQYSVTYESNGCYISYMFTIRIVLRANNAVDAVSAATDTFTTLMTPSKLGLSFSSFVNIEPFFH